MKKFLIIDTFNFLHRAYHALPQTFRDSSGAPVNAVYGVTSMLISIFESVEPDCVLAALDGRKPTFRSEEFTAYKAHRKPMEDDLSSQIPKVFEIMDAFGIKQVLVDGYEADDVIAAYAIGARSVGDVVIASNDRDLWQLVRENVSILVPSGKHGQKAKWYGPDEVKAELGFDPAFVPDYKGLRGDPSDNIPGVFGIGEKTASKLIADYGSLEDIYSNIENIEPESLKKKLIECTEQAFMSKRLAQLSADVPVEVDLSQCKYHEFNKVRVVEVLRKYNFKSLIRRLGFDADSKKEKESEVPEDQLSLF